MNRTHTHKEAFCLMKYRDDRGNVEWIWNSRDGITPYTETSRQGYESRHVDWERDIYAPHHAPKEGDRIFVTLTFERAREYRRAYVERHWGDAASALHRHPPFKGCTKEEVVRYLAALDIEDYDGNAPDLITVTAEMAALYAQSGRVDRHPERRPTSL